MYTSSHQTIDPGGKFHYATGVLKTFGLAALALLVGTAAHARHANVKELIKTFQNAKSDERARIAPILGHARTTKATEALIQAFDIRRSSPKETTAIVDALGIAGDSRAVEPLAAAWDYLRSMILQMGELPGHLQVIRWKILESLSRVGGGQSTTILSEALNDKDPRVVEEAVRGLGRLQVKDALPALQQLASGAQGNQLQAILEALGDIGDKRALSTLEQAKSNPDKFVEIEAYYALAKLNQKGAVDILESALKRNDPGEEKVGLMAAYYLVKLDKTSGLEHLERLMKKADSPTAPLAAEALGKSENPRAVLVLVDAIKAPDASVRLSVARALGLLGGSRADGALKKLKGDPNPGVRAVAQSALSEHGELD